MSGNNKSTSYLYPIFAILNLRSSIQSVHRQSFTGHILVIAVPLNTGKARVKREESVHSADLQLV